MALALYSAVESPSENTEKLYRITKKDILLGASAVGFVLGFDFSNLNEQELETFNRRDLLSLPINTNYHRLKRAKGAIVSAFAHLREYSPQTQATSPYVRAVRFIINGSHYLTSLRSEHDSDTGITSNEVVAPLLSIGAPVEPLQVENHQIAA